MDDLESSLEAALATVPTTDVLLRAVAAMETLRTSAEILSIRKTEATGAAAGLHRLSLGLLALQRETAIKRNAKLAELRDQGWTIGQIAERIGAERTRVQKLILKGRRGQ